ncbi:MAG: PaaI family thioesterase [Sulfuritalea sp.]|nr:PaaI family thioesterase [Sulfuritalea sp.]
MSARDPLIPAEPDFAATIRRGTLGMPIARFFGVEFSDIRPGHLEAVLPYRDELSYRPGHFQGTAVSAVAYFAATSALSTLLAANRIGLTLDQNVKFLAPAVGEKLVARGRVISAGYSVGVGAADVFAVKDGTERLCATAQVTVRNVDRSKLEA